MTFIFQTIFLAALLVCLWWAATDICRVVAHHLRMRRAKKLRLQMRLRQYSASH